MARAADTTWRKAIFLWQFDTVGSIEAVVQRALAAGCDAVLVKSHDALAWMAQYDRSPLAIRDTPSLLARRGELAAHGLRVVPWCVPSGVVDRHAEVALAAEVATALGEIVIDAEPYDGYWRDDWMGFRNYLQWLRQAAPNAIVHVTLDAPYRDYRTICVTQWADMVNGYLMPQDYWTTFREAPVRVLERSHRQLAPLGHVCHVLPLAAAPEQYEEAQRVLLDMGADAVAGWAMHSATDVGLAAFGGLVLHAQRRDMEAEEMAISEELVRAALDDLKLWYEIQAPARKEIEHLAQMHGSAGAQAVAKAAGYAIRAKEKLEKALGA